MKKSIFQKDNTPHGSLREQPEMKEPDWEKLSEDDVVIWGAHQIEWGRYLKTLRTIPCSENNW